MMLTICAGPPPRAMWRRASSREQKKVPSRTIPTTARQPFGESSSAFTTKLPAALLTSVVTGPSASSAAAKAASTCSGSRTSQGTADTATHFRDRLLERLRPAPAHGDLRAEPVQLERHRAPEAAAAAGDERDAAGEGALGEHHTSLPASLYSRSTSSASSATAPAESCIACANGEETASPSARSSRRVAAPTASR